VNVRYGVTVELGAALPFPVSGIDAGAIHSVFGDQRDAGSRRHEGVDILAQRSTPVIAVADGRAVPARNNLGGIIVWLNTAGVSYYYAHLEKAAMRTPRRVRAGDVLGYVGNSGNAARTPPHLHFGIYRWGRGPIDPLPSLRTRRFPDNPIPGSWKIVETPVTAGVILVGRDSLSR
jgi:murein DD-endopeptidase MepM/ murein hydrolase activator NlpD